MQKYPQGPLQQQPQSPVAQQPLNQVPTLNANPMGVPPMPNQHYPPGVVPGGVQQPPFAGNQPPQQQQFGNKMPPMPPMPQYPQVVYYLLF